MRTLDIRKQQEISEIRFSEYDTIRPQQGSPCKVLCTDNYNEMEMEIDLDNLENLKLALDKAQELWGGK